MSSLIWHREVELTRPIVVAAFSGWNDAADAATMAVRHLIDVTSATLAATVDPEDFYEFQATRPHVRLVDGHTRELVWPGNEIHTANTAFGDIVFITGIEPQLRWRTFCRLFTDIATEHRATMAVTFGALLADVHHRGDVSVIGSASDERLIERYDLQRSRYEGPTGIVGVLSDAFTKAGSSSVSLWAATPAYAAQLSSPKAARALVRRFSGIVGVQLPEQSLRAAVRDYEQAVDAHVASDDDLTRYVAQIVERTGEPVAEAETETIVATPCPTTPIFWSRKSNDSFAIRSDRSVTRE